MTDELLADRYRLGGLIGRGGMADVYEAEDTRLGRTVAIKLLHRNLAIDEDVLARFEREAQSAAGLNHPSIVTVYDNGEVHHRGESQPYIVMERIQGQTLREVLDAAKRTGAPGLPRGFPVDPQATRLDGATDTPPARTRQHEGRRTAPLEVPQAVALTSGVLSALAYSHRKGVVHRDIKPANVMLTNAGNVKVMDFGIARVATDATAAMTRTNTVLGTAQYLSPEQANAAPVDARSDLYSTGCMLYELLTGRPPFTGETPVSLAYKHVHEMPDPPSAHNAAVPEVLDRVVMQALSKQPADRYPDAEHFRTDLANALAGGPVQARPVPADRYEHGTHPGGASPTMLLDPVPGPARSGSTASIPLTPRADSSPSGPAPQDGRKDRRGFGYVAMLLAVLLVAAGLGYGFYRVSQPEPPPTVVTVPVPDVRGLTLDAARAKLSDSGLTLVQGPGVNSDTVAKDKVAKQAPDPFQPVDKPSDVTVNLSTGPAAVKVPDVVGKSQAEARKILAQNGLEVGNVDPRDDPTAPKDTVTATSPDGGSPTTRGAVISLIVSSGKVTIDNFVGQDIGVAQDWFKKNNLKVKVNYEPSDKPANQVVGQDPGNGSVAQGGTVNLYVATTPTPTDSGSAPSSPDPSATASPTQ